MEKGVEFVILFTPIMPHVEPVSNTSLETSVVTREEKSPANGKQDATMIAYMEMGISRLRTLALCFLHA